MEWRVILLLTFVWTGGSVASKNNYYMDTTLDCGYIGVQEVGRDQTITVHAKTTDTSSSSQGGCSINFQAVDGDAHLQIEFVSFAVRVCGVKLYLAGGGAGASKTYSCGDRDPPLYFSSQRSVTVTLHKTDVTATDYNFQLRITALRERNFSPPSDSNPIGVGLVVGIVGGVFGVIFIISCIGICCFRKYRVRGPTKSPYLFAADTSKTKLDESNSHNSVGYTNENVRMGSPMSKKKLLAPSDSSDERSDPRGRDRYKTSGYKSEVPPPPPVPNLQNTSTRPKFSNSVSTAGEGRSGGYDTIKNVEERGKGTEGGKSNPMISGLNSNARFRNSFIANEREAEERAQRLSSTSSFEKFGNAPTPPSSNESISRPTLAPVPKSPKGRKSKHATISRNPRPPSLSSDDLKQIDKGPVNADRNERNVKKGTKVVNDRDIIEFSSASSVDEIQEQTNKTDKKKNTTHSLRPDRKGPKGRKKEKSQSVSSALDPEPSHSPKVSGRNGRPEVKPSPRLTVDRVAQMDTDLSDFEKSGSGRYNKRASKSPKHGRKGKGFSHRKGRSADRLDSRPTTPTSNFGSMEGLDYLEPFQRAPHRTSSKSSLYSSRSSLYDRSGRRARRRHGSYSESIASHTRDDMSIGRHSRDYDNEYSDEEDSGGYEKPLSRSERHRFYRSETDIGRRVGKEIATQTLRETATQTGPNESVIMKAQVLVKKKRRSRNMSSSGTQTHDKKEKEGKDTAKVVPGTDMADSAKPKRKKTKRSKSVDNLDAKGLEKPKTKPKPAPRKSMSALDTLDETNKTEVNGNMPDANNPYYPTSEGFAPNYYGYPMVPPPGYPEQPGMMGQGHHQPYPMPIQPGMPPQGQYPYMMQQGGSVAPPQNAYPQAAQSYGNGVNPAADPKQRKKSNWEILCALTDGETQQNDMLETGSIASSVFTNNPSMQPGYGAPSGNQPYYNQGYYPAPTQQYPAYPAAQQQVNGNPQVHANVVLPTLESSRQRSSPLQVLSGKAGSREHLSSSPGPAPPKMSLRTESIV